MLSQQEALISVCQLSSNRNESGARMLISHSQAPPRTLEQILQRELNLPLRPRAGVGRALDRAGGGAGQSVGREEEVRMVRQVGDFGAELKLLALGDAEEARDAQVEVVQSGAAHGVATGIAEHSHNRRRPGDRQLPNGGVARAAIA